jgi:hypothetical protein
MPPLVLSFFQDKKKDIKKRENVYVLSRGVTDGVRTHNHWSHNPELHLLSYGHHVRYFSTHG